MLSSVFSLNASARQGACKRSRFKSIGVSLENPRWLLKTIMGFREGLCTQYFQIRFSDVCFFVCIYDMEQFKLKVGRCFAGFPTNGGFDWLVTGRSHFTLSERSLSFNSVMITQTNARWSARIVELASDSSSTPTYCSVNITNFICGVSNSGSKGVVGIN